MQRMGCLHELNCLSLECMSWVWHATSSECYLKNNYDFRRSKEVECEDCIAYSQSGKYYIFSTGSTAGQFKKTTTTTTYEWSWSSWGAAGSWEQSAFGSGGWGWASGGESCTFIVGFDQPAEFNIQDRPFETQGAFQCCDTCGGNDSACFLAHRPPLNLRVLMGSVQVMGVESRHQRVLLEKRLRRQQEHNQVRCMRRICRRRKLLPLEDSYKLHRRRCRGRCWWWSRRWSRGRCWRWCWRE